MSYNVMGVSPSFRPLTGIKVSELGYFMNQYELTLEVSVPSRGLRYLNERAENNMKTIKISFRPLTGIKVSERFESYTFI